MIYMFDWEIDENNIINYFWFDYYFLFGLPFKPKCADNPDLIPNNLCRIIPNPSNVISMIANDAVY